ncbi:MAG: hypothetical protein IJ487_04445 [Ruminococcus sp.]|nr:hypothetical protein [Ruminococcus sp.]
MNRLKKFIPTASACAVMLTGCSFGSNIDNLMTPPKLSVEQEQIYAALTGAAGTSISLKYPKSGKYLSAFIVEDIDGDGASEAIVFYEKTGLTVEENTLRINILDQSGGKWRSVCDTPAEGAEIEKVIISKLGTNERVNVIIGSSLINRSEKNASIYTYDYNEGTIEQTFSEAYSFFDVTDLDNNMQNEFLLLAGSATGAPAVAEAYKLDDKGKYHKYSLELSGSFTEFDSLSYGNISGNRHGLYIDAVSGTGYIQTDIVYMDKSGLVKAFESSDESIFTVRPAGCPSYDIDGDGFLEIPVLTIAPGYEKLPESEQLRLTRWMSVNEDNTLSQKYLSYYSINDGYIFVFPERWQGKVTVGKDLVNDEIVFKAYTDGKEGRELMRIYCAEDEPSRQDRLSNGYMLMHTKGDSAYLVSVTPKSDNDSDDLAITSGDAAIGFKVK